MDSQITNHLPTFRKQLEKFVVFNEEEWSVFASYLKIRNVKKKEHVIENGQVCKEISFIVSGSVRFYHVKDGQDITNYFCLDNEFVSSYRSFLQQAPGHTNIQALEDVLLITFTHQNIQQLLANPLIAYKMERFGRLIAEYLICCYEERVVSFITLTPEEVHRITRKRLPFITAHSPALPGHLPGHHPGFAITHS